MFGPNDVYGPAPAMTPQVLAAPVSPSASTRSTMPRRAGAGEPAMSGDPVLIWVVLLGLAIALGWVSFSLQVGG